MAAIGVALVCAIAAPEPTAATDAAAPAAHQSHGEGPAGRVVEVRGAAELGYHTRQPIPTPDGVLTDANAVPAAAATFSVAGSLRKRPQLQAYGELGYRSGLGMRAAFEGLGETARTPRVRSQDLNLDLGVRKRLARTDGKLQLGVALGYVLRPFHVEAKIGVPGYALHGPTLTASAEARLAHGIVLLTLAPRAGAGIVTRRRDVASPTVAGALVGGAVGIGFRLRGRLFLTFNYREQHALLRGPDGQAHDVARWATGGLALVHRSPKEATP